LLDKLFSAILAVVIIGAIGASVYLATNPDLGEGYTEFYILGPGGSAEGYPSQFILDEDRVVNVKYDNEGATEIKSETGSVILGIVNNEYDEITYSIKIQIDVNPVQIFLNGDALEQIEPIMLAHGEKWENEVGFAPSSIGERQKVDFILYKEGVPYFENPLHLYIDVLKQS